MREVKGYVCFADFELHAILFGKRINTLANIPRQFYENWRSNDFTPYDRLKDAKRACKAIKKNLSSVLSAIPAKINMKIAEKWNFEEIRKLNEKSLVVIMINDDIPPTQHILIGGYVEGKQSAYPLSGAYMEDTKFKKTINRFESAEYIAHEVCRQGQCPALIAEFHLEKLV